MSEGEKKEEKEEKIKGCESGNISMTDTLEPIKYRGCKIILKVREWHKVESMWISGEYSKIAKLGKKTVKEISILGETVTLTKHREETDKAWMIAQILRLGAQERIFDEGWSGVKGRLLIDPELRKKYKDEDEVPCTIENFLALGNEMQNKIATRISDWFNPISLADLKNLSGE